MDPDNHPAEEHNWTAPETPEAENLDTAIPPAENQMQTVSPELSIEALKAQEAQLRTEIEYLKTVKQETLQSQVSQLQSVIERLTQESLAPLEQQKQELQSAVAVLQRKQERLQTEMKTSYAGASQDVAVRVQGFKDYLIGSLQDLVASAEKLQLVPKPAKPLEPVEKEKKEKAPESPKLSEQSFGEQKQKIEQLLERYRTLPDYYGATWKLRRTFETVHAERAANWFFGQAGRGAIRTMGTRLQNILVAASIVSVLRSLYGDKVRVLILATSPERVGEWRRGFQDCLGINRDDFGRDKGIALFEDPEPLSQKGDRLVSENQLPLVIIDEAEEYVAVDLLRFPMLLAFGNDPQAKPAYSMRDRDFRDF